VVKFYNAMSSGDLWRVVEKKVEEEMNVEERKR
jgi:hypothetical protein